MSTQRVQPGGWACYDKLARGPNGRCLCRHCGTEVPKGRRTFCSDQCVDEWQIRTNPTYMRVRVWERDHGVCALCGVDTDVLRRMFLEITNGRSRWQWTADQRAAVEAFMNEWRIPWGRIVSLHGHIRRARGLWDADHILPVAEGGGACGIDNIRTLCIPCHRDVTRELRGRLAAKRKEAR